MYIGPSGIALIGQFQNFSQIAMTFSQGGINTGIVKFTSQYKSSDKRNELWFTAICITLTCCLLATIIIITYSSELSLRIIKESQFAWIFVIFGLTIPLYALNQITLSILNGLKKVNQLVITNISQSVLGLALSIILIYFYSIQGALLALVLNQSVIFITLLIRFRKIVYRKTAELYKCYFSSAEAKKLLSYSMMSLTTAIIYPSSLLFIRNLIGKNISWEAAGYWQSMWYISTMYLMVFTSALSIYLVPKLSAVSNDGEIGKEIFAVMKIILPAVCCCSLIIYTLKDLIIDILFTSEFSEMRSLFKWQLIGDVIKIASWIISYILISKARVKTFMLLEIVLYITFISLSYFFIIPFGLVGVTYSYSLAYSIYLLSLVVINKSILIS